MAAATASIAPGNQERSGIGAPRRRIGVALCASAAFHLWLNSALPGAWPARVPPAPSAGTLTARIQNREMARPETMPLEGMPLSSADGPERGASSKAPHRDGVRGGGLPARARMAARPGEPGTLLPPVADTTWYTAQDLDAYPRADAAIRLGTPADVANGDAPARLLLWLRVDEQGAVVEVSAGEPGTPSRWVELARAGLAAVRFTPARKDDRPVRSRLLLSVNFFPAGQPGPGSNE